MDKVQAKDISDDQCMAAVRKVRGANGVPEWSSLWDVQRELSAFPSKIVLAKLRAMVKKGKLSGCTCGCRGDFEEP
jgi:hypothetical protein